MTIDCKAVHPENVFAPAKFPSVPRLSVDKFVQFWKAFPFIVVTLAGTVKEDIFVPTNAWLLIVVGLPSNTILLTPDPENIPVGTNVIQEGITAVCSAVQVLNTSV